MTSPPSRYVDITTALATRGIVNVIAVVVDVWGGAWKSQGTSTCITFTIKDSNLNNGHTWDGLKIKYFKDTESLLPPVREGDVILLRNLWVKVFNGRPMGVAAQDQTIPWAVFRPDRDPTSQLSALTGPVPFEPSYSEKSYALSLLDGNPVVFRDVSSSARPNLTPLSAPKTSSTAQGKFSLLQDVQDRQFVDVIGEIVKIHGNDSEKTTIYLTDYTTNPNLFHYAADNEGDDGREGDPYNYLPRPKKKWQGPSGQMTIQITLWEPHASHVREHFNENDIVRLKNVRIKGSRVDPTLEGILHTNRDNPDAVNAFTVDASKDGRVKQFLSRKTEYWEANPPKRKPEQEAKESTKKARNNKKQATKKPNPKKEEGQTVLEAPRRPVISPYIRAGDPGVQSRSLEWILNDDHRKIVSPEGIEYIMPFQNACYRTTVRVLDFFPPRLEDFAVPDENQPVVSQSQSSQRFTRWQWRFILLLESYPPPPPNQSREYMELFVFDAEGVHLLLKDAADLRKNPDLLAKLREKLFLLWGDLEERKRAALDEGKGHTFQDLGPGSSIPFNCCVKEYGIKCEHPPDESVSFDTGPEMPPICIQKDCFGWEKRFAMFMTTINDRL